MSVPAGNTSTPKASTPHRSLRGRLARNLRWQLPPVLLIGAAIAWIDRANLGVAAPSIQDEMGITPSEMGFVLGSYAFVLIFMHPLSGWLVDRLRSPRWVYFGSAIAWFVFTSATALVRGVASLFAVRFLLAVGEAPQASAALKAASKWFPKRERALAIGTYEVGSEFGGAIAVPIVAALIAAFGWRMSFVTTGLLGLIFALFWLWFYRDPERHKRITPEELRYLREGGAHVEDVADDVPDDRGPLDQKPVPWVSLFRYRTVWGLMMVMFCRVSVNFFFITWYPSYLVDERGFSLLELGLYGAIPGLVAIVGDLLGGWFSDHLIRRGTDPTKARKIPITMGLIAGATIGLAALADTPAASLALLSVSAAGIAFCTGAIYSYPLEVAPTQGNAVSISGLMRAGGLMGGFLTPILIGFQYEATDSFVVPLLTASGLLVAAIVVLFTVVGPARPLPVKTAAVATDQ
ncbi:MFS transporter [Mycobacterium sp. NPDC003449]